MSDNECFSFQGKYCFFINGPQFISDHLDYLRMYIHNVSADNIFEMLPELTRLFNSANNSYFGRAIYSIQEAERDEGQAIQLKHDFTQFDYSTKEDDTLILNESFSMGNYKVYIIGEIRITKDKNQLEQRDIMRMLKPMGAYMIPQTLGNTSYYLML